jgi:hypothetical protein
MHTLDALMEPCEELKKLRALQIEMDKQKELVLAYQKECPHPIVIVKKDYWESDNGYGRQTTIEGGDFICPRCGLRELTRWGFDKSYMFPKRAMIQAEQLDPAYVPWRQVGPAYRHGER